MLATKVPNVFVFFVSFGIIIFSRALGPFYARACRFPLRDALAALCRSPRTGEESARLGGVNCFVKRVSWISFAFLEVGGKSGGGCITAAGADVIARRPCAPSGSRS